MSTKKNGFQPATLVIAGPDRQSPPPPDSVDPQSVTKNPGFWLPMGFADSSVTKEGRFWLPMQPDGLSLLQGCATEWPPGHMAVKKCLAEACFLQASPLEGRRMGIGVKINV